uniref:FAD2-5 protein n=1 Tax=Carthamus tinctorius TaxID=4222 RepID=L7VG56_CARTI|nr:FAD2-5 protein [Carthamus tinctorius]
MGAGGRMNDDATRERDVFKHVPVEKPSFGIADLKKAIPPHCFKRSLTTSFYYLFRDLGLIYAFYYIATKYITHLPQPYSFVAWPLYWIAQGAICMGLWNIVHDCGHHCFSDYQWLDDTIGFICHSFLLTPYFSFKYSHRTHHANTSSLERDEVWVPKRKHDTWFYEVLSNPVGSFIMLVFRLFFGFPLYFMFNLHGRIYKGFPSHFNPLGPIFNDRERANIWLSDAGVLTVVYALYRIGAKEGLQSVLFVYIYPLMAMSAFFIMFTYLHHTHPSIAHYDSSEWDWLRGALSTVDRDYGILNNIFHDVTSAHVVHHLFSSIPHYNTVEATQYIKPILGDYYNYDYTPILKAIWRDTKECLFIEEDPEKKGVYWFHK